MPILEVSKTFLVQRCATCEGQRELVLSDLSPTTEEGSVLSLPACACGAVEFLIGAPPDDPEHPCPGSCGHLHRLVVNALVAVLREAANDTELELADAVSRQMPQGAVQKWFPEGLKLEPSVPTPDEPELTTDKDEAWTPN